jgi:SAM-dependent methyltransferase
MNTIANQTQHDFWNGKAGEQWASGHARFDAMLRPIGLAAIDKAAPRPGEHVLDVGCGGGETLVQLASRLSPGGRLTGIDLSAPLLELARERSAALPVRVELMQGDVQTHTFSAAQFDLLFSRFGVMFFADPVTAFRNLRQGLKADGRLAFACWRQLDDNAWIKLPREVVLRHVPPPPSPEPGAPGMLAFADADHVRAILTTAGFRDVALDPLDSRIQIGGGAPLDQVVEGLAKEGPMAALIAELPRDRRAALFDDLRAALAPYAGADGVQLGAGSWIVTARAG